MQQLRVEEEECATLGLRGLSHLATSNPRPPPTARASLKCAPNQHRHAAGQGALARGRAAASFRRPFSKRPLLRHFPIKQHIHTQVATSVRASVLMHGTHHCCSLCLWPSFPSRDAWASFDPRQEGNSGAQREAMPSAGDDDAHQDPLCEAALEHLLIIRGVRASGAGSARLR